MWRGAVPGGRRSRRGQHLPLPYVPEGDRRPFWPLCRSACARLDARAAQTFQSSNKVWRGFCEACGTPLTFEYGESSVGLAIGTLDNPVAARPIEQLGSASKLPWVDDLAGLPTHAPTEPRAAVHLAGIVSLQHPDHDT